MKFSPAFNLALRFCKYYVTATNRHGLQAPFAYQLNDFVFRMDKKEVDQEPIENLRRKLVANKNIISVLDFGAGFGGKVYKELSISYIAKNSAKPPRYARMLYRLVKYLKPATILELGTSLGISALYQAAGNPSAKVITLEGCPQTAAMAQENFNLFPEFNIEIKVGPFDETLPEVLSELNDIDFLFMDGHHQLEATFRYLQLCYPKLSAHAAVIIDDINWSEEMRLTWKKLVADERFTLSLDVFMVGILFTSKALSKENFVLRY